MGEGGMGEQRRSGGTSGGVLRGEGELGQLQNQGRVSRALLGQGRFGGGEGSSSWSSGAVERGREDVGREGSGWPVRSEEGGLGLGEKEEKREKREERFTLVHDMWDQEGVLFSPSSRWSRKE